MKYCKNVHFSDSFLTLPSVSVNETNENVIGNYNDFNNTVFLRCSDASYTQNA